MVPARRASHVRWLSEPPELRRPVLIAAFQGWNDAGDAASMSVEHVGDRLDASLVADLDPEPFYDFSANRPMVKLEEGKVRTLEWPTSSIRCARVSSAERDVVCITGPEPQLRWRTFSSEIVAVAQSLAVERVITVGALLADVPHSRPVEVFGTSDDLPLSAELELNPPTYEGPTGIVGILTTACRDAGIPTASFWAAVPSYVPTAPSPKAGLALVEHLCDVIGTSMYVTDLEIAAAAYERQVSELVAEDEETADYVNRLEEAWDGGDRDHDIMPADPATLVAEVERFLRDND